MEHVFSSIKPGMTEIDIKSIAEKFMICNGITSFWYYDIGALVYIGNRTTLSISGKEYYPTETVVKNMDIVTIDLSPAIMNIWGDYARTFVVGTNSLNYGIEFQNDLHSLLKQTIHPEITFHDLFHHFNKRINNNGFENLDFKKNLGHTIESFKKDRIYIEDGNKTKIKDIDFFTFEPHIRRINEPIAFKMENIYYYDNGTLNEL